MRRHFFIQVEKLSLNNGINDLFIILFLLVRHVRFSLVWIKLEWAVMLDKKYVEIIGISLIRMGTQIQVDVGMCTCLSLSFSFICGTSEWREEITYKIIEWVFRRSGIKFSAHESAAHEGITKCVLQHAFQSQCLKMSALFISVFDFYVWRIQVHFSWPPIRLWSVFNTMSEFIRLLCMVSFFIWFVANFGLRIFGPCEQLIKSLLH